MEKFLSLMKSISDAYLKISEDEIEPFLQCYLDFKSPLKNLQLAYDSSKKAYEASNTVNKGDCSCTDYYEYYGITDKQTYMECPFAMKYHPPVIAKIERIRNGYGSCVNLTVTIAPIWTDIDDYSEKYLLISTKKRKYSGYVLHLRHPEKEPMWYEYLSNIISYTIEKKNTYSCKFVYNEK